MKTIFFLLIIALLSSPWGYARGGAFSGGGGGSTSRIGDSRVLVDYLWISPKFQDIEKLKSYRAARAEADIPSVKELAVSLIRDWDAVGVLPISYIEYGFSQPDMWLVSSTLESTSNQIFSKEIASMIKDPKLAAYYSFDHTSEDEKYRIEIYAPEFFSLGLLSQVGVLMHESLRHSQWRRSGDKYFSEDALQKSVAILALCKPRPILQAYVGFLMADKESLAENNYGKFAEVIKQYCVRKEF